jgi:DNA processing protein
MPQTPISEPLILGHHHPAYPQRLRQLHDAPDHLFVAGDPAWLSRPMLAIVGSRNATLQGCRDAAAFAKSLSMGGITIVSGLATGIDTQAHQGALGGIGSTVAVLGSGLDLIYPPQNQGLAQRISQEGALISEYPLSSKPEKWRFPRRNRIIAGLALGTLVIEAGLESGSLITARLALEAGREVFALPGSIHSPQARGCHRLIKEGAKLVETCQDILEELNLEISTAPPEPQPTQQNLPRYLAETLHCPATLDQLCEASGLTPEQVSLMLSSMELSGRMARLPGGRFQVLPNRG